MEQRCTEQNCSKEAEEIAAMPCGQCPDTAEAKAGKIAASTILDKNRPNEQEN